MPNRSLSFEVLLDSPANFILFIAKFIYEVTSFSSQIAMFLLYITGKNSTKLVIASKMKSVWLMVPRLLAVTPYRPHQCPDEFVLQNRSHE